MAKMLICYYTRSGHTRNMAEAIAEGARQIDDLDVTVSSVQSTAVDELLEADAILLGSPTYYGSMAAELKSLLDQSVSFHGRLAGKVGGAFASSANIGGGNETTIMDLLKALLIHGMVVQGVAMGDHYGPVAIGDVDDRSRTQCANYGKVLGHLAVKLHG